jgi:AP-1 complex subunit beta-1
LKKLVYLYLINYAKTHPDLALLAVNTFTKDANDPNPLIRALSIRTMGCVRVDKITEYLCEPLSRCLRDEDPYVRKTAAVCVAKLYDIAPELVEDRGFVDTLRDLIGDANPTVVANAVAALECKGVEVLIPLATPFIEEINRAEKILKLSLPEGILEVYLNTTDSDDE